MREELFLNEEREPTKRELQELLDEELEENDLIISELNNNEEEDGRERDFKQCL